MTRTDKITRAKALREQGLTYREIGERVGVAETTAMHWLKPEWAKERRRRDNVKRGLAKRMWARARAGDCENCGAGLSKSGYSLCPDCARARRFSETKARIERFIELRRQGLLNTEIAQREGISLAAVASAMCRAKNYGLEVPPSPYRPRFPEQVAR